MLCEVGVECLISDGRDADGAVAGFVAQFVDGFPEAVFVEGRILTLCCSVSRSAAPRPAAPALAVAMAGWSEWQGRRLACRVERRLGG